MKTPRNTFLNPTTARVASGAAGGRIPAAAGNRSLLLGLAVLLIASGCGRGGATESDMPTPHPKPTQSGHAPVNGIEMYYEVHGRRDGVPLVLLHGGGSTIEVTFGRVLPMFARTRMVIAVEEQGHGRTSDRDAPVAFESSADDVAALLQHLEVEQADILGFSNGAGVGLQVAIRHPQRVRRLIFASAFTRREGAQPQLWEYMEQADFSNMPQPLKDAFLRVNPDARQLRTMHDKDAARMRSFEDVPDDLVRSVRAPTLIVIGDRDIVRPEHAVELARLIPGARLLILPAGHGDYLGEAVMTQSETRYPELTVGLVEKFLDAE
jgi:pimeloyl-ACP methyl ester carboxylesterase